MTNKVYMLKLQASSKSDKKPEIGGHECPRFVRVMSVIFLESIREAINFLMSVSASMSAVSKFVMSVSADVGGQACPCPPISAV